MGSVIRKRMGLHLLILGTPLCLGADGVRNPRLRPQIWPSLFGLPRSVADAQ